MDNRAALVTGVTGQTVEYYPVEWSEGVPSAAAGYAVYAGGDSNDAAAQFSGTATMDTTALALDEASGYSRSDGDRRKLGLAATNPAWALTLRKRLYLVEGAGGQRELARFKAQVSGESATAEKEFAYDYPATTSYIKGFRQSFVVDPTFIANLGKINAPEFPYRVLWTYTIAAVVRRHWTYFDVVRAAAQHGITPDDVYRALPWLRYVEDFDFKGDQGVEVLIEDAAQQVRRDMDLAGVPPNDVLEGHDRLVLEAVDMLAASNRGKAPPGRDVEAYSRERVAIYKGNFQRSITGMRLRVSQTEDGAITSPASRPVRFRS